MLKSILLQLLMVATVVLAKSTSSSQEGKIWNRNPVMRIFFLINLFRL